MERQSNRTLRASGVPCLMVAVWLGGALLPFSPTCMRKHWTYSERSLNAIESLSQIG